MVERGERRGRVAAGVAAWVVVVVLVVSRARLVAVFGSRWTDEDQSLLWFAARDLLGGHVREPYFYGQPYGSWLESVLAAPLVAVGAPFRWALPVAASVVGTVPWLLFGALAWWSPGRRRPVVAVGVLAAGAVMAVEGSAVSTMPRGLLPGVVLGCVAVAVVVVGAGSRWASVATGVFGLLLVASASMNVGAGLVTGPVAVWVVLSSVLPWRSRALGRLGALVGGLVAGGLLHLWAQSFYRAHPAANVHGTPAFSFSFDRLTENVGRLARYLPAYAPEVGRSWLVVAVAVVAVAAWVAWTGRSVAALGASVTAVALPLVVLGTAKANDGAASLFFPYSRVYLGLPWMLAALAVVVAGPARRRWSPSTESAAVVAVVVVALAAVAVREVRLDDRTDRLVAAAQGVPPVVPGSTTDLERRCALRLRLARSAHVAVVLDRYDRTATYGCGALLEPDGISTLFPEYDRRTWLLEAATRRSVRGVLASGFDDCPTVADATCEIADAGERLVRVTGRSRPITQWAKDLGLPVRPT